jgi:hypothetical protein
MAISNNDIVFVLSGGSFNKDPNLSLGGDPSSQLVISNTFFNRVTEDESREGNVDFRCFYVFNNNLTDTFYDTELFIQDEIPKGSNILLGATIINDVQQLVVSGTPTSGSFTLSFDTSNFVVNFDSNPVTWALNFENALNAISQLNTTQVSINQFLPTTIFTITFANEDGKRNQPLLQLVTNGLSPASSITINKITEGSPINSISSSIDVDIAPPNGILFSSSPIVLGDLKAEEGFPVWVQRTTIAGTKPLEEDGFTVHLRGNPI